MRDEEIVDLEYLKTLLEGRVEKLKGLKQKMDIFANLTEELDKKEEKFLTVYSTIKELNEKIIYYFEGVDLCKELQSISYIIEQIKMEYEKKGSSLKEKIINEEFSERKLNEYIKELSTFLEDKTKQIMSLDDAQKRIFNDSIKIVRDSLVTLKRLLNTLIKRVEGISDKYDLKDFLNSKQIEIQQIEDRVPAEVGSLNKKSLESLKGLYVKTMDDISLVRESLRNFAVKNGLLDEREVVVLETIYELGRREFEFNELIELLKERMSVENVDLQNLLLSLSRKGFFTLKLIAE
jgi:molybdopterin converting factor small subunit